MNLSAWKIWKNRLQFAYYKFALIQNKISHGACANDSEKLIFLEINTINYIHFCLSSFDGICFLFLSPGRVLLSQDLMAMNCTKPALEEFPRDVFDRETRRRGAIVLHFLLACYLFILLAFVCDDYFIPSIKTICDRKLVFFFSFKFFRPPVFRGLFFVSTESVRLFILNFP